MEIKRVFGLPTPTQAAQSDSAGIPQVVLAMARYLPEFGYELVEDAASADLIAHHAGNGDGNTDVAHCHGLYPTAINPEKWEQWHEDMNARVINDIRAAKAVTVPSQWVADLIRRDMHIEPDVIGWGVHVEDWQHNYEHKSYVLWNKNRPSDVCTTEWLDRLAAKFQWQPFVTTFGKARDNVQVTGVLPHAQMKPIIQQAGIYLASTKETGDIGSREALASGVPVLGFAQGALLDIVQHGANGFLAEVDDFEGLCAGLDYIKKHHAVLSQNARISAQSMHWRETARQIAVVYDRVLGLRDNPGIKVSIVIPTFNYGHFVGDAIRSACKQQCDFEYEVIVINDGSTDDTEAVLYDLENQYHHLHVYHRKNRGVAHARNEGIQIAYADLVCCLDADDQIKPTFLAKCAAALDADPSLGIVYTGLELMDRGPSHWPGQFDYDQQKDGHNQIPTCCMFRKVWWQRAGGFRQNKHPAEDADLWLRMTSLGAKAQKITEQPLFVYRMHDNSASAAYRRQEKIEPDWTSGKGWIRSQQIPFAAPKPRGAWPVRNYDRPDISIVVPVGPGHEQVVTDALDSIEGQSFVNWECILVNDTGNTFWDAVKRPYCRLIDTSGPKGAGAARNRGMDAARGKCLVFLDADDYLLPDFLAATLRRYMQTGDYVYTDWYAHMPNGEFIEHVTPDFAPGRIYREGAFHAVTALLSTGEARAAGGFDESLKSWEDVEFFMRLIQHGHCGMRLPHPLVVYRLTRGSRRELGVQLQEELKPELARRFADYVSGEKEPVCGCRKKKQQEIWTDESLVEVVYKGPKGNHEVRGRETKTLYGYREGGQTFFVYAPDAQAEPHRFEVLTQIIEDQAETVVPGAPEAL